MTRSAPIFTAPSSCLRASALAVLACAAAAFGQTSLSVDSPFAPAGTAAGAAAGAPAEAFELAGSSVQGSQVTVCIFERQNKHSQWIPVGGEMNGVHVISFDAAHDVAVVAIAGQRKQLSMRRATVASTERSGARRASVVAPDAPLVPIAAAPEAPAIQTNAARDQREARMLVSDLLEIGVQQRKAYQEAKLKAASGTPAPPQN